MKDSIIKYTLRVDWSGDCTTPERKQNKGTKAFTRHVTTPS
ncbi:MAG: hypothetical protein RR651_14610 [Lysinibacillus sp.]